MSLSLAQAAVFFSLLSTVLPLFLQKWPRMTLRMSFVLLGLSGITASCSGVMALIGKITEQHALPLGLPWLHVILKVDPLSGLFLFIVGFVTFVASCYGPSYAKEYLNGKNPISILTIFTGLFVCGMYLVLLAADAFSFMVSWELMSVASYFLVAYQHHKAENRNAAFLYLLMAVVGGAFLLLAFGVLAGFSKSFSFFGMTMAGLSPTWASIAFVLAFIGFGLKAGIVPLHVWLPQAHPVAPSHISALMSGVMLKVAIYGFVRFVFDLLGTVHWQWGVVVLLVGAISSVLGVLYALMQHDLKRLLAYHSVENIGIIYIGLGLCMIFYSSGEMEVAALALIAALYHCLNHALFKSLLFLGAGTVLQQTGQHDMEHMGGLIKKMPVSAFCFLIGCISISALPPFNGFVSEWLTFQAALQGPILSSGIIRAIIPVAAALLALTGALATACFVKVYGVVFLGLPRTHEIEKAHDPGFGMKAAQIILALCCLLFGIFPGWTLEAINAIPAQLFDHGLTAVNNHEWLWLTPIDPQVASYGPPAVLFGLLVSWLLVFAFLHPPRRDNSSRVGPAWDCGFGPLSPRMQYTASAFAMPIRRVFALLWVINEKVTPATDNKKAQYSLAVHDRFWLWLYVPIGKLITKLAARASLIQGGNLRVYLCYSFFTLLFLLWVIV